MTGQVDPSNATSPSPPGRSGRAPGRPAHDVFVSYSSLDKPVADAIVARLEQAAIRCWVAPRDIVPGEVWGEAILRAIETSRLMVVVVSGSSNGSRHVVREVERAVANDVVVVPFRIESIEPTGAMAFFLASEHWLDAMTPPLEQHIAQLVSVAEALLGTLPTWRGPTATAGAASPAVSAPTPPVSAPAPAAPGPTPAAPSTAVPRRLVAGIAIVAFVAVLGLVGALALASSGPTASPPGAAASPSTATSPASSATASPSASSAAPSSSPEAPSPSVALRRSVSVLNLATGDCLLTPDEWATDAASQARFWRDLPAGTWPETFFAVPCDEPHGAEAYLVGDHWGPDATFPGDEAIQASWAADCAEEFLAYAGVPLDERGLDITGWTQDAEGWDLGLRTIACIAYDRGGADLQGSQRAAGP